MRRRALIRLSIVTLLLAGILHVAIVKLIPIAITSTFMSRVVGQFGVNRILANPLPTDKARAVVKPSPDLLYATCIYDVSAGPVRVSITPPSTYWSLSLFERNSDNFFKLSAADVKGGSAELIVGQSADADRAKAAFPSSVFVAAPGSRGVMLARLLVLDPSHMVAERAAQQSVRCETIPN